MGEKLALVDEGVHTPGAVINWNESRYVDFWDPVARVGGWFRIGNRPNQRYAEMSACVFLPDGTVAFNFARPEVSTSELFAGGQTWEIVEPFRTNRMRYVGDMTLLSDPWQLVNPKLAFTTNPHTDVDVDVTITSTGLGTVMGQDQDQHHLIFLPGQADWHYQHLAHVTGTIRVGEQTFTVDGRGGKDHSWGARNWHAKIYLRWLIAAVDDDNGFMLVRAVGPTKQTRSGFLLHEGTFHVVDDFELRNTYAGPPNYELQRVEVDMRAGDLTLSAVGTPQNRLPLRHRQPNEAGEPATLRIVKQPSEWVLDDGRTATGHNEYHDLMVDGVPVGLHE